MQWPAWSFMPSPDDPTFADESALLDEAMKTLGILNAAGKHTKKSIDRHVALTIRYEEALRRRKT